MDPQLRQRRLHTAQHFTCTGRLGRGEKSFNAAVARPCFKSGKLTTIRNAVGEEVTSSLNLHFDGLVPMGADDEFVLEDTPRRYPVLGYSHFDGLTPLMSGTTVVYL